jgi:hypothetical protein
MKQLKIITIVLFIQVCNAQTGFDYLGQTPPGVTPKIFAPGIITLSNRDESVITFSPDGKQLFFSINQYPDRRAMFMEYKNGEWTNPEMASFSTARSIDEPSFSLDGNRIYYNTNVALNLTGGFDISYSEKQDSVWSNTAISLGSPLNSTQDDYHPCIVSDSSIYFAGNSGEICRSQYLNGVYQSRVILPYPINYANASQVWGNPFVSANESYMIFQSSRSGGYGGNDLYISYKKTNGSWTNPKNLGSEINTNANDSDGDITPDGKYMTFNREWKDIYWVSSSFIDSLRYTNFVPYVKRTISNRTVVKDSLFNYQIPDSTFIDDDGNNTLRYAAILSNGTPLPAWLSFDSITCVFSGIPDTAVQYNMKVTATDAAGASVSSAVFRITVTNPPAGIKEEDGQVPKGFKLDQNYPNPFNPSTTIHYSLAKSSFVKLNIYNLLGQKIKTLIDSYQSAGEHSLVWDAMDERKSSVSSGVYFYCLEAGERILQRKMILIR